MKSEKLKIIDAIRKFSIAMKAKMLRKMDEGYHGWDDSKTFPDYVIRNKMASHYQRLIDGNPEEVDIANFLMLLWFRRKESD